jgi:beta-lactam-binding protein with PASTA domain
VVMSALAKDPALRWQSAEDFAAALEAARGQIEAGVDGAQGLAAVAPIPLPAPPPAPTPAGAGDGAVPPAAEPQPRRRRWPWFTIGLLTLALAGFLLFLGLSGVLAPEKVEVPRVTGQQLVDARAELERAGFEVAETRVRSGQPLDQVIDQDPNAGEEADEGATVTLEISNGPGTVRVPSVARLPQKQAIDDLQDADLRVTTEHQSSDEIDAGFAIRTVPRAGEEVERDTRVTLFVSTGPEQVTVPDVIGLSGDSAESSLAAEGFGVAVQEQESAEPEGEVIAQSPGGGTEVDRGTTVTITVSTGIEQVDVPDVIGLTPRDAEGQIRSAGLTPVRTESDVTDPDQDGVVIDQRPGAGVELDEGGQVVIIVGVLRPEEEVVPLEPSPEELAPEEPPAQP